MEYNNIITYFFLNKFCCILLILILCLLVKLRNVRVTGRIIFKSYKTVKENHKMLIQNFDGQSPVRWALNPWTIDGCGEDAW